MKLPVIAFLLFSLAASGQQEPKNFQKHKSRFKLGCDLGRGNPAFYYEHLVEKGVSIELGVGLTFDDYFAIQNWSGHQYIERNNFSNTRFSFSFGLNFQPVPTLSFLYLGIEGKIRTYYSSDQDFFLSSSGYFLGAKRSEAIAKFRVGNFFQFNRLLLDYSVGIAYMSSNDKWAYYDNSQNPNNPYHSGKGSVTKAFLSIDLKIGLSGKKVWE